MDYEPETMRKTFIVTSDQDRKLKYFCKRNRITASQLFRFFIDDLHMADYDTARSSIESTSCKTQNFVGAFDREPPYREGINENGQKKRTYFKKSKWFNTNIF